MDVWLMCELPNYGKERLTSRALCICLRKQSDVNKYSVGRTRHVPFVASISACRTRRICSIRCGGSWRHGDYFPPEPESPNSDHGVVSTSASRIAW